MKDEIKWRLWIKDSERFCLNPLKPKVTATLCGVLVFLGVLIRCLTGK